MVWPSLILRNYKPSVGRTLVDAVRRRQKAPPAHRAGAVREEPHVDALWVEAMLAFGQQAESLLVLEVGEADDTVRAPLPLMLLLRPLSCFSLRRDVVGHDREPINRRTI